MAYEKTNWVNGETPISAENLNKMEEGIEEAGKTGGILEGTIVAYDGDTIPEGYEEVDNPNVYSTTEKVIGEWINGKKIYRKVITGTTPNIDKGMPFVKYEDIIKFDISVRNASNYDVPSGYVYLLTPNPSGSFYIEFKSNSDSVKNRPFKAIVEYTKTTD